MSDHLEVPQVCLTISRDNSCPATTVAAFEMWPQTEKLRRKGKEIIINT